MKLLQVFIVLDSIMKQQNSSSYEIIKFDSFGQGVLSAYKPHLNVRKVRSPNARSNRSYSHKTDRTHQFLSDNEERYFWYLEWAENVYDIREQFPLQMDETIDIAKKFGVKHPSTKDGNIIMTTDFLITLTDGTAIARALKESKDLDNKSVLEKLSIEKYYWESKGFHWGIVHTELINRVFADNVETFMCCKREIEEDYASEETIKYLMHMILSSNATLADVFAETDNNMDMKKGNSQILFKSLIANKMLKLDMFTKFTSFMHTKNIKLSGVI
jgi:hypothetical protein